MSFPASLDPYASMWVAALQLLIHDALCAAFRGHKAGPVAIEALGDVMSLGPMTQRLCAPIAVAPELVRDVVRAKIEADA